MDMESKAMISAFRDLANSIPIVVFPLAVGPVRNQQLVKRLEVMGESIGLVLIRFGITDAVEFDAFA